MLDRAPKKNERGTSTNTLFWKQSNDYSSFFQCVFVTSFAQFRVFAVATWRARQPLYAVAIDDDDALLNGAIALAICQRLRPAARCRCFCTHLESNPLHIRRVMSVSEDSEVESVMICIPCNRELGGGWCDNCKYFERNPVQPAGSSRRRFEVKPFGSIPYPKAVKSLFKRAHPAASTPKAAPPTPKAAAPTPKAAAPTPKAAAPTPAAAAATTEAVAPSPAAAAATTAPAAPPPAAANTLRDRRLKALPSSHASTAVPAKASRMDISEEDDDEAEQAAEKAAVDMAAALVHREATRVKLAAKAAAKKFKCADIIVSPPPVGFTVSLSPAHTSDADAAAKLPSANVPSSATAAEPPGTENAAPAESDLAPKAVTDDESEGEQEMPEGHDKPSMVEISISEVMSKSCKDIKNFVRNLHDQKGFDVKFKLLNIQKKTVDECKQWLQQYSYHLKQARLGCWKTKLSCRDKVRV